MTTGKPWLKYVLVTQRMSVMGGWSQLFDATLYLYRKDGVSADEAAISLGEVATQCGHSLKFIGLQTT